MMIDHIPSEIIQDILQYMVPSRLREISDYSDVARYIVNGMERGRYIDRWLINRINCSSNIYNNNLQGSKDMHLSGHLCHLCNKTIRFHNVDKSRIKYVVENYWYFELVFDHFSYKLLLENMGEIKNKKLWINLSGTIISDMDLDALANIHCLDLSATNISNIGVNSGALDNISYLCLNWCKGVTNIDVGRLYNVKTLRLYGIDLTDMSLGNIALGNIHSIHIIGCNKITEVGIGYLANIHSVNLSIHTPIRDINALKNVHTLNMLLNDYIKDNGIVELGNVHNLDLSMCKNITDAGVLKLNNVYSLKLTECNALTDNCMMTLGNIHDLKISTDTSKNMDTLGYAMINNVPYNTFVAQN